MTNERKEVSEAPVNFGANLGLMLDLYDDFTRSIICTRRFTSLIQHN